MLPVALLAVSLPTPVFAVEAVAPLPAENSLTSVLSPSAGPVFSTGAVVAQTMVAQTMVAQAITPAADDVGTIVTPIDNQINITGGQVSGDGANLFHSFDRFGLNAEQTATFVANPQIQNILGRVNGGTASYIDGILQISDSNASLYLLNPAGILFGQNAQLDLTGSFMATTADRIGFEHGWFDALNASDYSQLNGVPVQFSFGSAQAGSLVNLGNLGVDDHQSLTLLGGTVVNAGQVTAPGGRVTLSAVNGQQIVTLGSMDGLLSMELAPLATDRDISVLSLPELLTGGDFIEGTELAIAPDGTVSLQGTSLPAESGTLATGGVLDVTASQGGQLNLLGSQIALLGAELDASGMAGGGTIRIGGGYQGNDAIPNADGTYVSADTNIRANADTVGDGGLAVVWADGLTQFYGSVDARGGNQSGDGGFVEISGKNQLVFRGTVDTSTVAGQMGTLLLDPTDIIIAAGVGDGDGDSSTSTFQGDNNALLGQLLQNDFDGQVVTLFESELEGLNGDTNIILQATNDIIVNDLADDELTFSAGTGTIEFLANSDNDFVDGGDFVLQDVDDTIVTNTRNLLIRGENLRLGNIVSEGGNIELIGDLTLPNDTILNTGAGQGNIVLGNRFSFSTIDADGAAVDLTLLAGEGDISIDGELGGLSPLDEVLLDGANVDITFVDVTALGDISITAEDIPSLGFVDLDSAGDISITTEGDLVGFRNMVTSSNQITVDAGGDIDLDRGSWVATNDISLTAGRTLLLRDYPDTELIIDANGLLTLQGNERIRLEMDNDMASLLESNGDLTLRSDGVIVANAILNAGGDVLLLDLADMPNALSSTSANTLISSDGNVTFGNYTGLALKVEAQGSINGGSITIVAPNPALAGGDPDIALLNSLPALVLRAGETPQNPLNTPTASGGTTFDSIAPANSPANITVGDIDTSVVLGPGGPVILSATGNITTGNINTETAEVAEDDFETPPFRGGFVDITAGNSVTTQSITTSSGYVDISGTDIKTGSLDTYDSSPFSSNDITKGPITLTATTGAIEIDSIRAGAGGLIAEAVEQFRVTGRTNNFFLGTLGPVLETELQVQDSPEVIDYLVSQGFDRSDLEQSEATISIFNDADVPASIIVYSNNFNSPVTISHGGIGLPENGNIQINGGTETYDFAVGPEVSSGEFSNEFSSSEELMANFDPLDAAAELSLTRRGGYRPYETIPEDISGTRGAIVIGNDGNGALNSAFLNRPLPPEIDPPVVDPPVVEPPVVDPPVVVNPDVDPPVVEPPVVDPPVVVNPDVENPPAEDTPDGGENETLVTANEPDIETSNNNDRCQIEDTSSDLVAARSGEERSVEDLSESCLTSESERILQIDDSINSTLEPSAE